MQKWVIQLTDQQLNTLNDEARYLGELHSNPKGEHYLVFRDSFVALKVAKSLGTSRTAARTMPASEYTLEPLAELSNGQVLVAA